MAIGVGSLHPEVILAAAGAAALYAWAMRRTPATRGQAACFVGSLVTLLVALNGPLHDLSDWYLFSAHMVQHLIFTLAVPPLLLTGLPGWMIDALLRPLLARPASEWVRLLAEANVPAGPVNRVPEILSDEHLLVRGMIVELEHPAAGLVRGLGNPIHLSQTPPTYRRPAPLLGEHNAEVWGSMLGCSDETLARLREAAVL